MPGWEGCIRITPCPSWSSDSGALSRRGYFLYADSTDLDFGAQMTERDQKLLGLRESPPDTVSVDRYYPRGGFTYQPRVDDILMVLMAHFQECATSGVGTYTFTRANAVDWTIDGSNYSPNGSSVYSINVDLFLGAFGAAGNGFRYTSGIVDKLAFSAKYGGDIQLTPTFKFLAGSHYSYPLTGYIGPTSYGSFSEFGRLVDYQATVTIANSSFNVESWTGNFSNNTSDRSNLGNRGYVKFPFSGRWVADGEIEFEVATNVGIFAAGGTANLTIELFNSASNWIKILQPNIYYRPSNVNIASGDSPIMVTKGFRAYPLTTGSSTTIIVCTGTSYGSALFGFGFA